MPLVVAAGKFGPVAAQFGSVPALPTGCRQVVSQKLPAFGGRPAPLGAAGPYAAKPTLSKTVMLPTLTAANPEPVLLTLFVPTLIKARPASSGILTAVPSIAPVDMFALTLGTSPPVAVVPPAPP